MEEIPLEDLFIESELRMGGKLMDVEYGPKVEYVYNPLEYAKELHYKYLKIACRGRNTILFLGMNPGPWGMMQTGVPFGETSSVRDFLHITGTVEKPKKEHPNRPILGLDCKRSEVSGKRFWSLASSLGSGSLEGFFANSILHNYFPLCLLNHHAKNITPPELQASVQKNIEEICDESFVELIKLLKTKIIIAIGRFAEKRAQKINEKFQLQIKIYYISHPSPRNPASNKNWIEDTKDLILVKYGLKDYFS